MTQPLPAYFCSSSHNTYLTGLQVTGEATVEGYVAALKRGARLLELDLFDGEGAPVITHKRTLIQPITLKDTLQVLKRLLVLLLLFAHPLEEGGGFFRGAGLVQNCGFKDHGQCLLMS